MLFDSLRELLLRQSRCERRLEPGADARISRCVFGRGRRDAKGDDAPRGRSLGSAPAGLAEFLRLTHDVVCGQHEHERVVITFRREHGRHRDGGT